MTTIVIKLDDSFDLHTIDMNLRHTFNLHTNIIFIFDIDWRLLLSILPLLRKYHTEIGQKLDKSIIVAPYQWQHYLLQVFFALYRPIKPYEIVYNNDSISF